ncbi:carbohydrate kinase family protein [Rufibacter quisquiliarum]|uniref:Fructokinase n=1 Tax=Rufibacter quisquiliarum TaxID=1549639 RepID=A0A839GYT4_9BACT|nr:carbohydrate kinase [Rufibacter quisquiliarum]MBA9079856.1 fructokinase [Rufibacter quisquiliarum]
MPKEIVCFGEMLWDLLPTGKVPGGAPMNVAIHLTYQGQKVRLISRLCHDELGRELILFLREKGLDLALVQVEQTHPTGTVVVNTANKTEVQYSIVAPAAWDFITYEPEAAQTVSRCDAFVFGSLAARQEITRQTLRQYLPLSNLNVLDVNLRPPFYSQELLEDLLTQAHIAKMNHHELAEIRGWYGVPVDAQESMRFLVRRFGLDLLIVTRGEHGALALQGDQYFEQAGFTVDVADTIGSGDAFLATFLALHLNNSPVPEALKQACRAGSWVATKAGATPIIDWDALAALDQNPAPDIE